MLASAPADLTTVNPYAVFPSLPQADDRDLAAQAIVLQGELGLEPLLRAVRLSKRSQVWHDRPQVLMGWIALSLVPAIWGVWAYDPAFGLEAAFHATAAGLAVLALICLDGASLLKFGFYMGRFKSNPFRCTFSTSGVKTEYSRVKLDDPWSRFSGFSESDDMIVLWRKANYIPLPKEFSADEGEWQRLRDLLHTRLPLRKS
jgi:hypothetical protein